MAGGRNDSGILGLTEHKSRVTLSWHLGIQYLMGKPMYVMGES